jgi:hypothetical protein
MRRWRSLKLDILNGYTLIEIEVLLAILLNVKMSSTLRSDDSECYEYHGSHRQIFNHFY